MGSPVNQGGIGVLKLNISEPADGTCRHRPVFSPAHTYTHTHTQPLVEWGISQQRPDKVLPTHAVLSGGTASWASEVITWIFCLVLAKTQPSSALPLLARR